MESAVIYFFSLNCQKFNQFEALSYPPKKNESGEQRIKVRACRQQDEGYIVFRNAEDLPIMKEVPHSARPAPDVKEPEKPADTEMEAPPQAVL